MKKLILLSFVLLITPPLFSQNISVYNCHLTDKSVLSQDVQQHLSKKGYYLKSNGDTLFVFNSFIEVDETVRGGGIFKQGSPMMLCVKVIANRAIGVYEIISVGLYHSNNKGTFFYMKDGGGYSTFVKNDDGSILCRKMENGTKEAMSLDIQYNDGKPIYKPTELKTYTFGITKFNYE